MRAARDRHGDNPMVIAQGGHVIDGSLLIAKRLDPTLSEPPVSLAIVAELKENDVQNESSS